MTQKTGAGAIPEHAKLTKAEEMVLEYAGEERVTGTVYSLHETARLTIHKK